MPTQLATKPKAKYPLPLAITICLVSMYLLPVVITVHLVGEGNLVKYSCQITTSNAC